MMELIIQTTFCPTPFLEPYLPSLNNQPSFTSPRCPGRSIFPGCDFWNRKLEELLWILLFIPNVLLTNYTQRDLLSDSNLSNDIGYFSNMLLLSSYSPLKLSKRSS